MKYKSLVIIALFLGFTTQAQDTTSTRAMTRKEKKEAKRQKVAELMRQAEEGVLVFSKHSIFGVQLRTNGYGLFYELGKMKTNRKANIYRIDFTEVKENKEEKLSGNSFFGNAFIYGHQSKNDGLRPRRHAHRCIEDHEIGSPARWSH